MEGHRGFEPLTAGFEDQNSSTELMTRHKYLMPYKFNLPQPDLTIISEILDYCNSFPEDPIANETAGYYSNNHMSNIAKSRVFYGEKIQEYTEKTYQQYFKDKIFGILINLININSTTIASYPPHTDAGRRTIAINRCIQMGGTDVRTRIYKQESDNHIIGRVSKKKEQFDLLGEYQFNDEAWYQFCPQNYHSVHNIVDHRILYSICFQNIREPEFIEKHNHLIIETL